MRKIRKNCSRERQEPYDYVWRTRSCITSCICRLQMKFGRSWKDDHDLAQHVNVFNQIVSDLARIDVKIEDEDKAMILLCSLPPSYEHMVTTLTYGKANIKVEEITTALLSHNQQKQNVGESSQADSLYVKGNRDRGRKLRRQEYMKRDCPKLKNQTGEKRDDSSKSVNVVDDDNSDCSEGNILSISTTQLTDVWILDSGYSYHITPNRKWFLTYMSVNSGSVYLGDDRCCNIVGIGDARIKMYDGSVEFILLSLVMILPNCSICVLLILVNVTKVHFKTAKNTTERNLDYVHSDVWGPSTISSLGGSRYYVTFIDEFSRKFWVYFLKQKSDVFEKFELWKAEHGIKRHFTVRKTPQQNGFVKRMNRSLNDRARCLRLNAGLHKHLWAETVNIAIYLINRSTMASLAEKVAEEQKKDTTVVDFKQFPVEKTETSQPTSGGSATDDLQDYSLARDRENDKWMTAMIEKMESLNHNRTWELVRLLEGKKSIGCKWVHTSIRAILALVASWDLYLEHMNVKTAFLHCDLEEQIYMGQPEGFTQLGNEHLVCRLKKSLYGLKQSPRQWYKRFDSYMNKIGYKRCEYDCCIYVKSLDDGSFIFLLLYVDDMLIVSKNDVIDLKTLLSQEFDMKYISAAKKILGMEIYRDRDSRKLWLSQWGYVGKMLEKFAMSSAKPVSTPLANHFKLSSEQCPKTDKEAEDMAKVSYSNVVGCLMYTMVCTHPDLAHVVSQVCKYMSKPGKQHWEAVKWIFQYLKGTVGHGIGFGSQRDNHLVVGYVDSDYEGDLDNRRPTTGYVFTLGGGPICWKSTIQSVVALSKTEAEYMAAAEAAKEALWLTGLVKELGVQQGGVQLFCDNQSTIHLAKNQVYHARTKHIDVHFHKIRELVASGEILFQKVHTDENAADIFTKPVRTDKFKYCLDLLNVSSMAHKYTGKQRKSRSGGYDYMGWGCGGAASQYGIPLFTYLYMIPYRVRHGTFTKDDKMGDTEFEVRPYIEALKTHTNLEEIPSGTVLSRLQPSTSNCLAEESPIFLNEGKIVQDLVLRLRNVECGEVEIQLEWIHFQHS
ncbi:hypothetical protein F3Y22_tig00110777pilonHSYRG00394 [Hibiscus syriacus]|uniref:Integrase catalytic domain-containing protein n=1 Tax=Hibiscus syriacus TaxID=106335 RepID=A0A6A2ZS32_HIBSY|nr:hypothetical protein F3Y22_tig00110777pilonHSYRG00394 [Hibiscus syriacus]